MPFEFNTLPDNIKAQIKEHSLEGLPTAKERHPYEAQISAYKNVLKIFFKEALQKIRGENKGPLTAEQYLAISRFFPYQPPIREVTTDLFELYKIELISFYTAIREDFEHHLTYSKSGNKPELSQAAIETYEQFIFKQKKPEVPQGLEGYDRHVSESQYSAWYEGVQPRSKVHPAMKVFWYERELPPLLHSKESLSNEN